MAKETPKKKARKKPDPRPVIPYGDPFKTIAELEKKGQPWAIARFPMKARFVEGETTYCYELLIFQTLDREEPNDNFVMSRSRFIDVMQRYGLKCHYKTRAYGEIYAKDTKLRDIGRRYRIEVESLQRELRLIRDQQYTLTEDAAGEKDETLKAAIRKLRDEKRSEAEKLDRKIKGYKVAFAKKNKIVLYQIY